METVLKENGYPKRMIDEVRTKSRIHAEQQADGVGQRDPNPDSNQIRIKFPYVKDLSERLRRVCQSHGIMPAFKGGQTLRDRLTRMKMRRAPMDQKDVLCGIPCGECSAVYKGEKSQPLKKRITQHKG